VNKKVILDKAGVQAKLNALAQTPEFKQILREVVEDHNLVLRDVQQCVDKIYHEVSKHAHGNNGFIVFEESQFARGEMGVLTSFFRLQSKWDNPLDWKAVWEKRGKRGAARGKLGTARRKRRAARD